MLLGGVARPALVMEGAPALTQVTLRQGGHHRVPQLQHVEMDPRLATYHLFYTTRILGKTFLPQNVRSF